MIRGSRRARRCRQEIARLADPHRDGTAELPMTRAYFQRFMDMVQSEGEGSETSSEQIPTHVPQQPNDLGNLQVNMTEGMSQEGPTASTSLYTFANVASHVPEVPTNHEPLTWPQFLVPDQAGPVPGTTLPIPALGLPQDFYSNEFQQNISFTNLGSSIPTIPTNSTPAPYSAHQTIHPPNVAIPHSASGALVFHLQAIARILGLPLVPYPGAGT